MRSNPEQDCIRDEIQRLYYCTFLFAMDSLVFKNKILNCPLTMIMVSCL